MNAKDVLLKWLNGKLQGGRNVRNFTTDWNDGTLLCELVNALEPGLISPEPLPAGELAAQKCNGCDGNGRKGVGDTGHYIRG